MKLAQHDRVPLTRLRGRERLTPLPASGDIRIREAPRDCPEIEFEIKEFARGVMVAFAQREGVNVGVNSLLSYVQSHPGKRAGEMAVTFKLTQRTIERWLKQLKENGLIEFRGAAKTGGYYYLDADE